MSKAYHIVFCILVFILQLVVSRFLNFGPFIYVCFIPLVLSTIQLTDTPQRTMFISFLFALLFDLLSDGVLGLNASAAVIVAVLRKPMYRWLVNADRQDRTVVPLISDIGLVKYIKYLSAVVVLYLFIYILFDCISFRPFGFILLKLIISTVVNVFLSLVISSSFLNRRY